MRTRSVYRGLKWRTKIPLAANSNPCIDPTYREPYRTSVSRLTEQCANHLYDIQILYVDRDTARPCFIGWQFRNYARSSAVYLKRDAFVYRIYIIRYLVYMHKNLNSNNLLNYRSL